VATNDVDAAKTFCAQHRDAIYKSCSGLRSRVRRVDEALMQRLADGTTPVILQEYIPGRDVRVHVVGKEAFATEITSRGIDYRFETEDNAYRAATAPDAIRDRCVLAAAKDGLVLVGCDFRVTDTGDWYCLEMNPVPSFLPYEMETGQSIGASLLELMTAS
jgi:glutathione synthase/RimK-type ligase-like ATP-grasp enzyme